ncbi:MAG: aldo/keto reductase [Clostridia bacterium]|nr:aldo/keto reductase [Clostridia bacterium]
MKYRKLGRTDLNVSEIGFGPEWLERHPREDVERIMHLCSDLGINIFDCWMSEPEIRSNLGYAMKGQRDKWIIQGHIGSTWKGQYVRTRDVDLVRPAFEDQLRRFGTDYVDIGVINYVDEAKDFDTVMNSEFINYVHHLKESGAIRYVGMSTHNPKIGKMAVESGEVDMLMFSINPAFDMKPASENVDDLFAEKYEGDFNGIDPERAELYRLCEREGVGITVMKGFGGGRLFDASLSPFGVALTAAQCIHYALTRPAVASVIAGFQTEEQVREAVAYCDAAETDKDYATVLANAPSFAYNGQCTYCGHCTPCPAGIDIAMVNKLYDLAAMCDEPAQSVVSHYHCLSANAADCIGCGGCETRCPFGVKIVDRMEKAKKLFDR